MMATLLLSQGVPMLSHGDEIGRTQHGNNNVYCQDNELAWMDWDNVDTDMLDFTRLLTSLRTQHPILRRQHFFAGRPIDDWSDVPDILWLRPDGELMTDTDWHVGFAKTVSIVLNGRALDEVDEFGRPVFDRSFAMVCNASEQATTCLLPGRRLGVDWLLVFDTAQWPSSETDVHIIGGSERVLAPRSMLLLQAAVEPGTPAMTVMERLG
jgi:glycogen operon protein